MNKKLIFTILVILILGAIFIFKDKLNFLFFRSTGTPLPIGTSTSQNAGEEQIQVVAEGLQIPWEIVFLPDDSLLVTERPGQLVRINADSHEKIPVSGVRHTGEGGLLGMALHPSFRSNNYLYLYMTTATSGGLTNRVERYRFDMQGNSLSDRRVIIENIPGAAVHDGGRIAFGPDNMLYITTGDAGNEQSAQDTSSLAGKILRLNDDGSIPSDNPFGNAVYSYGHRNPQGLAWDNKGQLWATEHGPSGAETGEDEVNLIQKGANYGWPVIRGNQSRTGMISPVIESGKSDTWAPAGAEIVDDTIFFTGLRGEALYSATISGQGLKDLKVNFLQELGRLRVVKLGPDGFLYLATSNTDGRGRVRPGDDKIVKTKL